MLIYTGPKKRRKKKKPSPKKQIKSLQVGACTGEMENTFGEFC